MKFKFKKLIIWQDAITLGEEINSISEGSIGQSNPEQIKFTGYSIRSLAKVVTCLHKSKLRNYINKKEFQSLDDFSCKLMNMLIAFKNKINYQELMIRSSAISYQSIKNNL
jgi:hypothetical protein